MKLNFDNPWISRILSIVLALVLFFVVNFENQNQFQSNEPTDGASIDGTEIISDLPIEVNVDTERFFVSGIPDSATLRIQGPQAVIFQTVATQSYTVTTPNLNQMGEGTHTIELQVEGLADSIMWSVSPSVINVTVEEKVVEEYPVTLQVDETIDIANGYEIVEPTLSTETVQISGAASTVEQISEVIVNLTSNEQDINSEFVMSAQVIVLNEAGEPLNVNITPSQIEINVPVVRTTKSVPIVLRDGEGKVPGHEYNISLVDGQEGSITVRGNPDAIEALENFPIVVDFNQITESRVVTIPIEDYPEGIDDVNIESVEVLIEVNRTSQTSTLDE